MIARYRKKPVVIEATQFDGSQESSNDVLAWIGVNGGNATRKGGVLLIPTLEGEMSASAGDWVIRGVNGEFYPCKPDIFAKTYEPAD